MVLIYEGNPVSSMVEIESEKKLKVQSINQSQQVFIIDHTHSSFLFRPNDEENLQVYVKPLDNTTNWGSPDPSVIIV
jgi:hypothetical protein